MGERPVQGCRPCRYHSPHQLVGAEEQDASAGWQISRASVEAEFLPRKPEGGREEWILIVYSRVRR